MTEAGFNTREEDRAKGFSLTIPIPEDKRSSQGSQDCVSQSHKWKHLAYHNLERKFWKTNQRKWKSTTKDKRTQERCL
jgi:hypothetical protein